MKKKPKIHKDNKGEFICETYFIRGKMKKRKIYVINGMSAEEFYRQNTDPITLFQNEDYEMLHEQEMKREQRGQAALEIRNKQKELNT